MSKVFFSLGMSLDGFIAGPNRGPTNPLGDQGVAIHKWAFEQRSFREALRLGDGGETGQDNRIVEATLKRTGASIMGKRMFDEGERNWPEEAPFHTPVLAEPLRVDGAEKVGGLGAFPDPGGDAGRERRGLWIRGVD